MIVEYLAAYLFGNGRWIGGCHCSLPHMPTVALGGAQIFSFRPPGWVVLFIVDAFVAEKAVVRLIFIPRARFLVFLPLNSLGRQLQLPHNINLVYLMPLRTGEVREAHHLSSSSFLRSAILHS